MKPPPMPWKYAAGWMAGIIIVGHYGSGGVSNPEFGANLYTISYFAGLAFTGYLIAFCSWRLGHWKKFPPNKK